MIELKNIFENIKVNKSLVVLNSVDNTNTNVKVTNYYDWYISGYNRSSPIAYKKDGKAKKTRLRQLDTINFVNLNQK